MHNCIITEKVASAYATMLGALAMAFLGIVNEEEILETIHSRLEILFSLITAVCSAFLDNVTTILLMAPVSILLAKQLNLDSFPFVMTEVLSSDIGGMATLIGNPTHYHRK